MAGLFGNLKSSLTQSISEVSTQTSAQNQRQTDMSKRLFEKGRLR